MCYSRVFPSAFPPQTSLCGTRTIGWKIYSVFARRREKDGEFYSKLADSIRAPDYLLLPLRSSRNIFFLLFHFACSLSSGPASSLESIAARKVVILPRKARPEFLNGAGPPPPERRLYGVETLFVLSFRQSSAPVNVVIACLLPQLLFVAADRTAHI